MAYSITQFQNNNQNQLAALDNNFTTFGALVPIPCTVAGANTLTLTQNGVGLVPTPTLTAYTSQNYFTGTVASTNTGAITIQVGSLAALPGYKDTAAGPVAFVGGELVAGNMFSARYDAALNSGNGGFHVSFSSGTTNTAITPSSVQINGGATLTMIQSGTVALTFTATPGWSSQDQLFSVTGTGATLPAVGDFGAVVPPSLAAAGVLFGAQVTAVGSLSSVASAATIAIRLLNAASASLASNSGTYRWKFERTVP